MKQSFSEQGLERAVPLLLLTRYDCHCVRFLHFAPMGNVGLCMWSQFDSHQSVIYFTVELFRGE